MRRPAILALLLALALGLAACGGGDDDEKAAPKGPTKQQDIAAIEQVLLAYGAASGVAVCDFYSGHQIELVGGIEECHSVNEDTSSAIFKVENVAVNGDQATAIVTVKGQEDEVSTYELAREDGDWKISAFPSDDAPGGGGAEEAEPAPVVEEEDPEPLPPATPKVIVTDLLTDFGKASGSSICDFFSVDFIESQQGGRAGCEDFFGDKPASGYKPGFVRALSKTRAVATLKNSSSSALARIEVTEPVDSLYGGWRISEFQIQD